jgi:hypothetical protein
MIHQKRFMKLLHSLSSIGLTGGLATYMLVLWAGPDISSLAEYSAMRTALAAVATWLLVPSMVVVLVSGLWAMAIHYPYHEAPWVWLKALSGILIFEATLASIDAPAQGAAEAARSALNGEIEPARLAELVRDEWTAWWVILALNVANIVLATWRPRFSRVFRVDDSSFRSSDLD